MAQGDLVVFNRFKMDVGLKIHDLENDVLKFGLITNAVTPAANTSDPRWGAGGGTNLSSNQVSAGGNYASGGPSLSNPTYTESGGTATRDAGDVSIAQNASNPTNARWGIYYNDTATGKQCEGFLDLGGVTDLSAGDFSVTHNAAGLWTLA